MCEKIYHIYIRDECILHSLDSEEFVSIWESLNNLVEIFTEYQKEDLSFEEIVSNKQISLESSH